MQNKFKEAAEILENKYVIKEDKEGWEFDWRVLQIMVKIELSKYQEKAGDIASGKVEGIRNLFRHNEKNVSFTTRHKNIYKFLSLAEQKGFNFTFLNGKATDCLDLLASETEENSWQLLSSELIPFHKWARTKMKKKKMVK